MNRRKPPQLANEFRAQQNNLVLEPNNPIERKARHRVTDQLNIDRMLLAGTLTHELWTVAERILKYGHAAGMAGGVLESNLSKLVVIDGSTTEKLSFRIDAADRLHALLKGIDKGGGKSRLVYLVCIEDLSPTEAGKILKIQKPIALLQQSLTLALSLI